ncbi:MAG: stage II sporulation protein R [Oscillospiraceae bacterium]|jgi:stage II sporulation protein R|nr:stage II sporulation protein R [Oscillospiraceae bacterium]
MKRLEISILFAVIFCSVLTFMGFSEKCGQVRDDVFRLHVLANSDSKEDQSLKLDVRDKLLEVAQSTFSGVKNRQEAIEAARLNADTFKACAEAEIKRQGYDYPVTVEIGESDFNTRIYGDITLPAGTYQALRVKIGQAEGKNWWCVMFPQLCLPAAQDNDAMEEMLDTKEFELVTGGQKYEIKFKCVEYYEKLKKLLSEKS